jgi:nicotinamidase-related amidase
MIHSLSARLAAAFRHAAAPDPGAATALMIVDMQAQYCSPWSRRGNRETRDAAARIMRAVPQFRAAGIPLYPVYLADAPDAWMAQVRAQHPQGLDHYKFHPARHDRVVLKNRNTAFYDGTLAPRLRGDGIGTVLVCGFNLNACVRATACDAAAAGFDVRLLEDLCGNDNDNRHFSGTWAVRDMARRDVAISTAAAELAGLQRGPR